MDPVVKPETQTETNTASTENLSAAINQLWIRFKPEIRKRVGLLQTAAAARGQSAALREESVGAAHKLAGALGTFSLDRGTDLAREYELLASRDGVLEEAVCERLAEIAAELGVIVDGRK
jgi:HPt (histidine-containing phosphotransfer) domain-containing protein